MVKNNVVSKSGYSAQFLSFGWNHRIDVPVFEDQLIEGREKRLSDEQRAFVEETLKLRHRALEMVNERKEREEILKIVNENLRRNAEC
jgi:hypothetical protein